MDSQLIAFRCPEDLLERVDALAAATNSSRTTVIVEAVRIFSKEVRARGGFVVPPYKGRHMLSRLAFLNKGGRVSGKKDLAELAQDMTDEDFSALLHAKMDVSRKRSPREVQEDS